MIEIQNVNVCLPGFTLEDIRLTVKEGEFFALIGPTGAGKTLILESIVGLVPISAGHIHIGGRDVTRLPPEKRGVGIVYQDQALFPHLSVRENITFGLRYHRRSHLQSSDALAGLIDRLGLGRIQDRSIDHLSGGEKQRVALARALAVDPATLLLDEPLSSLDPNIREEIRQLLKKLHRETGISVLMVTHDFSEAHFLAQRVGVINAGRIEQAGPVAEVFQRPATPFVAGFVGMKNIFPAVLRDGTARVGQASFQMEGTNNKGNYVAIRPEHVRLSKSGPESDPANVFRGVVCEIGNQGVYSDIRVKAADIEFQCVLNTSEAVAMNLETGSSVLLGILPGDIHTF